MTDLVVREYGIGTNTVITVHGGPGVAGDVAPLAKSLSRHWHVLEPYQRGRGPQPLTVAMHVRDLHGLIQQRCDEPPVLVGHSWGAMLSLAYAAEHPSVPAALVLIGCGTFSISARAEFEKRLAARLSADDRAELEHIERKPDVDQRFAAEGRVMSRVFGYDIENEEHPHASLDAVAHHETWADMLRLQLEGTYPAAFAAIKCPVLMLHGDTDPHPGLLIRDDLQHYMPQLEYRELLRCGHSPWLERQASVDFLDHLNTWIAAQWPSTRR